jgi:hypothetical protein
MPEFTDLDRLSDEEIKTLWSGVRQMNQTPAGRVLIRKAAEQARTSGKNNQSRPIQMPAGSDPLDQLRSFMGSDENQE